MSKHLVLFIGGSVFGALLGIAGVSITMPSFYPLMLIYAIVQSIAVNSIFGVER